MPVLEAERIIHTKARGVTLGGQSVLLEMYSKPELIQSVFVRDGKVFVTIEDPFGAESKWDTKEIGTIKDEYKPLLTKDMTIVSAWRITGGSSIEGYHNFREYLGINITIKY